MPPKKKTELDFFFTRFVSAFRQFDPKGEHYPAAKAAFTAATAIHYPASSAVPAVAAVTADPAGTAGTAGSGSGGPSPSRGAAS